MNRIFRRFWPPFFEKLDRWILLNYPKLWATRIHGLLLALSGFAALIGLKVLITSFEQVPNVEVDFTVIIIISVLVWLGWMISMYTFRPGKYPSGVSDGAQYSLVLVLGTFLVAIMPLAYGMGINAKLDLKEGFSYWQEQKVLDFGSSYWTYDTNSLENSINTFKRNRNTSSFYKNQSEQEKVEMAMAMMEKYGGDFEGISSQQLLDAHHQYVVMPPNFRYDVEKANTNLQHQRDAEFLFDEFRSFPTFKSEGTHIVLFVFMLIGLLTVVFQHASMRQFVWALVALGVISIVIGLFAFVNEFSRFTNDAKLISSLVLGSYVLVGMVAFGKIKKGKNLQKTALILLAMAIPFGVLSFAYFGEEMLDISIRYDWGLRNGYQAIFGLAVIPAAMSFVAWITIFIPQLQKLQTAPPRK